MLRLRQLMHVPATTELALPTDIVARDRVSSVAIRK